MALLRWLHAAFTRFAPSVAASFPWLGGALMLIAAAFALHSFAFARTQQRSLATVTENVSDQDPLGSVFYVPRLRFRTQTGELVQILMAGDDSGEPAFQPGETLPVLYPPSHPEQAIIATPWRAYRAAIIFVVLGIILFDIGFLLRILLSQLRRKSPKAQIAAN
jgi:hypothetical protein